MHLNSISLRHVQDHVAQFMRGEQTREVADIGDQRRRVVAVVDESESFPNLEPDRQQAPFALVEAVGLFHRGRGEQRAVQSIAPGVIRAEDLAGDAATFQQLRPAMAAEIRESAQFTLVVAHDQNRPAHRFDRPVTAGRRPFVGPPDDDPPARMNMLDFRAKEIRRDITIPIETPRLGNLGPGPDIRPRFERFRV